MSELLPSLVGAGLVVGLALPMATLAAKGVVAASWRRDPGPLRHGSTLTFLLLLAPSLGALLWFASAGVHLSEPGLENHGCTMEHQGMAACVDAILFTAVLTTLLVTVLTRGVWRHAAGGLRLRALPPASAAHAARLARLCAAHPPLRPLTRRLRAVAEAPHPIYTRGLLRPVVEVSAAFMDRVTDAALVAALLHEAEHRDARDPLRQLLANASLALNPCGFLLRRELARWRAAREAVCDQAAVRRGADPLALADALVVVARMNAPPTPAAVGLGGSRKTLLRLRVGLLLDLADRPPASRRRPTRWGGLAAVVAVVILPHVAGAWPLDLAHGALERLLASLGLL